MKADLHVHTTWSKDGVSTPEQVIDVCVERGIGIVAISDHNEFGAYEAVKDNGRVIVIPAEEVSSSEGHIIGLGIDRRIPPGMGIRETIDAIHEAGGYAVAVHPYRWWSGLGERNVLAYDFDCTEALNARSIPRANRLSSALAARIGKPVTAGSDAHSPGRIGWGYVDLPDGIRTWQEAVAAIMDGKAVPHSASRHFVQTLRYGFKSISQWMMRGFKRMRWRCTGRRCRRRNSPFSTPARICDWRRGDERRDRCCAFPGPILHRHQEISGQHEASDASLPCVDRILRIS